MPDASFLHKINFNYYLRKNDTLTEYDHYDGSDHYDHKVCIVLNDWQERVQRVATRMDELRQH